MNESCYVISFKDLSNTNTISLETAIREYGTWARITSDTWAVVTSQSAVQIRDNLQSFLPPGGRLFVIKSGIEAAWTNVECSSEWLKQNL